MERFTQKWAIVCLLEEVAEGSEFYYTDFPLHVTLAGVFATDKIGQQLADKLEKLLVTKQQIEVEADQKAMFGPNQDVKVMKIKPTLELIDLYSSIYDWLGDNGVKFNSPQYEGEGYIPHSTFQKSGALSAGEVRVLESVSIVDLYPSNDGYRRKIFKTIKLE